MTCAMMNFTLMNELHEDMRDEADEWHEKISKLT
jgi:hypothetical protein